MFNDIVMLIMAVGILIGAIDKIIGNKFGLGKEFEEGFKNIGVIGINTGGIILMTPIIAQFIKPVIVPLFKTVGIDPSMSSIVLANDMGGYSLAMSLYENEKIGLLAGTTISSMIGCTIVFAIPVGIGMIKKENYQYFFKGVMLGIIAMPIGSIFSGLFLGISFTKLIFNCLPLILLAILMIIGIKFVFTKMVKIFEIFGRFITIIATIGIATAGFKSLTGITILKGVEDISVGMDVVIQIGIVLMGSYPILQILKKLLKKPFEFIGKAFGFNTVSVLGLLVATANSVPVFAMINDMDNRGKVVNSAWVVCAAACFGAHLGYTAGVAPEMISTLLVGKISAGVLAVLLAILSTKKSRKM